MKFKMKIQKTTLVGYAYVEFRYQGLRRMKPEKEEISPSTNKIERDVYL